MVLHLLRALEAHNQVHNLVDLGDRELLGNDLLIVLNAPDVGEQPAEEEHQPIAYDGGEERRYDGKEHGYLKLQDDGSHDCSPDPFLGSRERYVDGDSLSDSVGLDVDRSVLAHVIVRYYPLLPRNLDLGAHPVSCHYLGKPVEGDDDKGGADELRASCSLIAHIDRRRVNQSYMPVRDNLIVAEEAKVVDAVVEAYGLYYPGELPRDSKVMSILLIRCGYGAPLRVNDGREGYEIELLGQIGYAFPDF